MIVLLQRGNGYELLGGSPAMAPAIMCARVDNSDNYSASTEAVQAA